jgi:hypothetical protein
MSALLKRVAGSATESAGWAQTLASCSAVRLVTVISAASEKRCSNLLMLHLTPGWVMGPLCESRDTFEVR